MSIAENNDKSRSIEFNDVGPIKHLKVEIPEGGGVVVLKGTNGSGKTHALEGIESLYSKDRRRTLRNADGSRSGSIEGLGVTVRLGRSNTVKGELVCESLDGRVDPSLLVDPGIKDPLKADSKRLATLIRLGSIHVTPEKWMMAMADAVDQLSLEDLVDDDPVIAAERIRRRLHELALQQERIAKSKSQEAATLAKSVEDVDVNQPSDAATLAANLDKATSELTRTITRRESQITATERHREAKLQLESMADSVNLEGLQRNLEVLNANKADAVDRLDAQRETLRVIQTAIAQSEKQLEGCDMQIELVQEQLANADIQLLKIAGWKETVDSGLPEVIADEVIEELKAAKTKAFEAVQLGEVTRRALATRDTAEALADEVILISERADKLRTLARSTDGVLEQALIDAGFDTIKVDDGRLCVESDRGLEPFSELSHGERWTIALDLAANGLPKGSVLPVCQEAYESLDPTNRQFINNLAKERGLVIVTAEATDGELRAEILEGEVLWEATQPETLEGKVL